MAFSPQQHTSLLRDGLDFVPESDFRYLPINVRLKLVELEKTNGQVYLPKNEAASLKREVAAEKMSEVAKRNDPDAYFGGDPEYSSTPITDDPAELKGRLGTDEYGTRPTIYRAIEPEGAVFNNRYLTSGQYESQYKESDPTIYGRYTPTKKGDEILLPPTANKDDPDADRINETEPHEYMHRGMMPTNWLSKYLLGPIDSISEKVGVGNLFGTRVFAGNQHTYIAKALAEDKQKKQMADFERQTSKLSERELATLKKYLESERNKLQLEKNRIKKATGGEANNLQAALDLLKNPVPNIIKAPEKKNKKKSSAAALIELEVDPVFRVPTNVKTFVDSVLLNKKDNITNKNFSNSELKVVKDLIVESANNKNVYTESLENPFNPLNYIPEGKKTSAKRAKMLDDMKGGDLTTPGYVDYNTYNKKTGLGSINSSPGFHSVFSDTGKVLTTLGQFNYSILPNGDVQVTDTYDFNPMLLDDQGQESKRANAFTNSELSVLSGGYYPLRKLGEKLLPEREGKGRKINIVLPKDLFSKKEYSSIKNLTNSRIKKTTGGEVTNLQAALNMLQNPVTSSISPLGDPTLSPLMESLQKNPIDDFAMMMANPVKKVTSAARLAQLANPTNEVFKTATKKEIVDYIQTIPLKERLALRANDSIPLKGKYAILDSDKIDFYKDIVDLGKLPKNFKAGDNTLAKIYMEKNNIPSRVDITEPLAGFKPRPYFEEIIDFKKGTEKIKLSFPKTGVLQPYGAQTAYRTKTLTNPSKEQLDKLFKGMREKDLQKQLDGLRKAKSIENDPGSTLGDLAEATKLKQNASFKTSDDIAKELLELQGEGLLDTDLLAILRKQYNL
jgi:hypothetical protein